jgi:hypothetical protein
MIQAQSQTQGSIIQPYILPKANRFSISDIILSFPQVELLFHFK